LASELAAGSNAATSPLPQSSAASSLPLFTRPRRGRRHLSRWATCLTVLPSSVMPAKPASDPGNAAAVGPPAGSTPRARALASRSRAADTAGGIRPSFPYTARGVTASRPCSRALAKLARPLPSCTIRASRTRRSTAGNVSFPW
jgi:hypothetical protein